MFGEFRPQLPEVAAQGTAEITGPPVEPLPRVVVGAEGQLGGEILPGEVIRYVDGVAGEREVSVEYGERAVEVYVGRPVPREALDVDEETYGW